MTYKGVPSTYNKDFQEGMEPLIDTVDNILACLRIAEGVIATLEVTARSTSSISHTAQCLTHIT
jgi:argininosuccinate lyase